MQLPKGKKINELAITAPSLLWQMLFYAIPTFIIFLMAFKPADIYGGIGSGWTFSTILDLGDPNYPAIIWRTLWLSALSTAICIVVAVPIGYNLARCAKKWREVLLMLIIVPFWTNFLIRIFAWKVLLHPDGPLKKALLFLHLVSPDSTFLYNPWAVLAVMVYTYLPFAILPIYAAAEKFDFALMEAAQDLGASRFQAFRKIFLPGISAGIWTALVVVLIPSLGSYLIPDLVGGPSSEMLGDKIAQRTFIDRNLPHASALSAILMLAVLIPIIIAIALKAKIGGEPSSPRPKSASPGARTTK
jgi:spermidine/putrescine transport system permease protein